MSFSARVAASALKLKHLAFAFALGAGSALLISGTASAAVYTANFSGAINSGNANVKVPFSGNGFTQGQAFSGSFIFDDSLIPASGVTNVFFSTFPDIGTIPSPSLLNFTFGSLSFDRDDNLDTLISPGIQYKSGQFNGFQFVTNFSFGANNYRFRLDGPTITVKLLDGLGNPTGNSLINAHINSGNSNLANIEPFTPGSIAVPGPIAGAGLPALLGAGGVWFARRRRLAAAA